VRGTAARPNTSEQTTEVSLRYILSTVWRRLGLIVIVMVACTGAVLGFNVVQTPVYESSVKLLVGHEGDINPGFLQDVNNMQQLTGTVAEAVNSPSIAEEIIQQLDLSMTPKELLEHLSVAQVRQTQFIEVTYRDTSPQRAERVAGAVPEVLSLQLHNGHPSTFDVKISSWQRATLPEKPVSPDIKRNVILALVLSLVLGTGISFLLEYLNDGWHSARKAK